MYRIKATKGKINFARTIKEVYETNLNEDINALNEALYSFEIGRSAISCTVKVNDVHKLSTGSLEVLCNLNGVVTVDGNLVVIALVKSDSLAGKQVYRGKNVHYDLLN